MINPRAGIKLTGEGLAIGETYRGVCPYCNSSERTFTVTREEDGIVYACYRDSCRLRNKSVGFMGGLPYIGVPRAKEKAGNPYVGSHVPLTSEQQDDLYSLYRLTRDDISMARIKWAPEHGRYVLPILDPYGVQRGVVLRRPAGVYDGRKAEVHVDSASGPHTSWYYPQRPGEVLADMVLVEDIYSAIRVAGAGAIGIALLGTHLPGEALQEIAGQRPKRVIIALDNDATSQAIRHSRAARLILPAITYRPLQRDLKDMRTDRGILEALGYIK